MFREQALEENKGRETRYGLGGGGDNSGYKKVKTGKPQC